MFLRVTVELVSGCDVWFCRNMPKPMGRLVFVLTRRVWATKRPEQTSLIAGLLLAGWSAENLLPKVIQCRFTFLCIRRHWWDNILA